MITSYMLLLIWGVLLGGALSCLLDRLIQDQPLLSPSHCTECKKFLSIWELIPVISFLFLKGKCAHCKKHIDRHHLVIELGCIMILWGCFSIYGWGLPFIKMASFLIIGLGIALMDMRQLGFSIYFLLAMMGLGSVFMVLEHRVWDGFFGFMAGFLLLWTMSVLGKKIYKKDVMGEGDWFLNAGIGIYWGLNRVLIGAYIASILASIIGITLLSVGVKKKSDVLPFGPFLIVGGLGAIWFESFFWRWLLG